MLEAFPKKLRENMLLQIRSSVLDAARCELGFPREALSHFSKGLSIAKLQGNGRGILLGRMDCETLAGVLIGSPPEGGVGTIIWLVVNSKFRGQGVGKILLNEAFDQYRSLECHKVKLTVPSCGPIDFYLRNGMQEEGIHLNHWWNLDFRSMAVLLKKER